MSWVRRFGGAISELDGPSSTLRRAIEEITLPCEPRFASCFHVMVRHTSPERVVDGSAIASLDNLGFGAIVIVEASETSTRRSISSSRRTLRNRLFFVGTQCDEQGHMDVWMRLWPVDGFSFDRGLIMPTFVVEPRSQHHGSTYAEDVEYPALFDDSEIEDEKDEDDEDEDDTYGDDDYDDDYDDGYDDEDDDDEDDEDEDDWTDDL